MRNFDLPETLGRNLTDEDLVMFLDFGIRIERRLEALWRRAARGTMAEEARERLEFESYEDREHARILRRHRADVTARMDSVPRAPGARIAKIGRTLSPRAALREALELKECSRVAYERTAATIEDRYLSKFVEVLADCETRSYAELLELAEEHDLLPKDAPVPAPVLDRAPRPRYRAPLPMAAPLAVA